MTSQGKHILLVEDELNFGSVLSQFLKLSQFEVTWTKNGSEAWSLIKTGKQFDACILDVMMPEMDGFTLGKEIKKARPELPFIYLTAKSMKDDVVEGYKSGADDFITKPFDSEILVLKLHALLQRQLSIEPISEEFKFEIGHFKYDGELRLLKSTTAEIKLSPKENALLLILARNLNQVVSREEIITAIWEEDNYFTRRSMDVYMAKLRKYLKPDSTVEITSLHAGGYVLKA